jgi:2,4-dienoyl-CoA reductase-like NADH-dependent reductase (Old Yellow Enzyme family)
MGHSSDFGSVPVAPSPIAIRGKNRSNLDYEVPRELTKDDLKTLLRQFHQGALNAKEAGFDGIEIHGANGYLIDEFIRDATNKRTDEYGGSIENRCRFPLEVIDALIDVFGSSNVGIKLTPGGRVNDMFDSDPIKNYSYLIEKLNKKKIGFIELVETPDFRKSTNLYGVNEYEQIPNVCKTFRNLFSGILIANNSFDYIKGNKIIEDGYADMVSFGRPFISNPDLVDRFENNWPLTKPNEKTYYTKGEVGYTDYPRYTPSPKF